MALPTLRVSNFLELGWGLGICISNTFPSPAEDTCFSDCCLYSHRLFHWELQRQKEEELPYVLLRRQSIKKKKKSKWPLGFPHKFILSFIINSYCFESRVPYRKLNPLLGAFLVSAWKLWCQPLLESVPYRLCAIVFVCWRSNFWPLALEGNRCETLGSRWLITLSSIIRMNRSKKSFARWASWLLCESMGLVHLRG